jgi:ATP/maltotriose-dependent transcriptional regulator MalT
MAALNGPTPVPEAIDRCRSVVEDVAGDRRAEGLVTSVVGWLEAMRGDFDEARTLAERGRAILLDLGSSVRAPSLFSSQIEMLAGDPASAEADLRRDFDALTELGETYLRSTVACDLAQAVYAQGRYDEALELSRIAEELAARDDVTSQSFWRSVRARVLARRGKLDEAMPLADQAVELLRNTDALVTLARALVDQAEVAALNGDHADARAELGEAMALLERKGNVVGVRQAERRLEALSGTPTVGTGAYGGRGR